MKRFILFILTFVLIVSAIPMDVFAQETTSIYKPVLSIENMDVPVIDAGKSKKIPVTLKKYRRPGL